MQLNFISGHGGEGSMQEISDGNSFKDEDTGISSYVIVLSIT